MWASVSPCLCPPLPPLPPLLVPLLPPLHPLLPPLLLPPVLPVTQRGVQHIWPHVEEGVGRTLILTPTWTLTLPVPMTRAIQ